MHLRDAERADEAPAYAAWFRERGFAVTEPQHTKVRATSCSPLCVLDDTNVAYLPEAFSPGSQAALRQLYPHAVIATTQDTAVLGPNAVNDGRTVVLPVQATHLATAFGAAGYPTIGVDVSELRTAGGGPQCYTLEVRA